jgi:hypothetical protein
MNSFGKSFGWLIGIAFGVTLLLLPGCEIGTNPLIVDGSPLTATLRVDGNANMYGTTETVNLEDVLAGIDKDVDSIKIFNITLLIDSTAGTPAGTTLTGGIGVNTDTLVLMMGTPITAFSSERTIFDPTLKNAGFSYNNGVVTILHGFLQQNPRPTITLLFGAITNKTPIHFTFHFRLYTQVFTKVKN